MIEMLEKPNDFFKELKDRLSNPFIFSFMIAWLFFNWQITISLLLYKNDQLIKDGYISFIDLIRRNSGIRSMVIGPLLSAIFYTFVFPFFKNCVYAFQAWVNTWGTAWNLNLSKGGKIPVAKYLSLRQDYKNRTKVLQEALESETGYLKENRALTEKMTESQLAIRNLQESADKYSSYSRLNNYDGDWNITYIDESVKVTRRALISQGNIIIHKEDGEDKSAFKIKNIAYDSNTNEIVMIFDNLLKETAPPFYITFRSQTEKLTTLKNYDQKGLILALSKS